MSTDDPSQETPTRSPVDPAVEPQWLRTGYRFFPYAAWQDGRWWVLRVNYGFPEHDFATLFIDGAARADVTGDAKDGRPLVSSIGRLRMTDSHNAIELPLMAPGLAHDVVDAVAEFVNYGSEVGDPCDWCGDVERDPFTPSE
jgi:hypothetical protein